MLYRLHSSSIMGLSALKVLCEMNTGMSPAFNCVETHVDIFWNASSQSIAFSSCKKVLWSLGISGMGGSGKVSIFGSGSMTETNHSFDDIENIAISQILQVFKFLTSPINSKSNKNKRVLFAKCSIRCMSCICVS